MATTEYLSLSQAAKRVPSRPSTCSLWRWCRRGVKSRNGERVYLEHVRIGGQVFTTERWLVSFFEDTATADNEYFRQKTEPRLILESRTDKQRQAEIDKANRELEADGI